MADKIVIVQSKFTSIITTIIAVSILLLMVIVFFAWKSIRDENIVLRNQVVEFQKLTNSLVRSSVKWATKDDLNNAMKNSLSKEDLQSVKDDLEKLGARLSAVGSTIGSIQRKVAELEASDKEGPENSVITCSDGKIVDTYGYTKHPQIKELQDINKASLASVQFDASKEKPWNYEVFKRDYNLTTIVGKKDDGQYTFYHTLNYSVPDKDKDKKYTIQLTSSEYLQTPLKNTMYWLNLILDLNVFAGGKVWEFNKGDGRPDNILSAGFDVGISFSSFGETRADSVFRLWRLGMGWNIEREAFHFSFAPFTFNVGKYLPLFTNLYLTPQVAIDSAGGMTVNLGVGPHF